MSLFYLRDQEETMLKKRFHLFYSDRKIRLFESVKFDLLPLQLSQESTLVLETNDRCCILEFERWCTEKKTKEKRTSSNIEMNDENLLFRFYLYAFESSSLRWVYLWHERFELKRKNDRMTLFFSKKNFLPRVGSLSDEISKVKIIGKHNWKRKKKKVFVDEQNFSFLLFYIE